MGMWTKTVSILVSFDSRQPHNSSWIWGCEGVCSRTQLDNETDSAHGDKAHGNSLGDFDEFLAVGCINSQSAFVSFKFNSCSMQPSLEKKKRQ